MDFVAVVDQVIALLRQRGRVTYSTLKRQFQLDEAALEDVKNELIEGQRLAVDERGNVLVWTGDAATPGLPCLPSPPCLPLPPAASLPLLPRRSAGSSPCSSVTSWTRPCSPASSTRKTSGRWCGPIKTPVPR